MRGTVRGVNGEAARWERLRAQFDTGATVGRRRTSSAALSSPNASRARAAATIHLARAPSCGGAAAALALRARAQSTLASSFLPRASCAAASPQMASSRPSSPADDGASSSRAAANASHASAGRPQPRRASALRSRQSSDVGSSSAARSDVASHGPRQPRVLHSAASRRQSSADASHDVEADPPPPCCSTSSTRPWSSSCARLQSGIGATPPPSSFPSWACVASRNVTKARACSWDHQLPCGLARHSPIVCINESARGTRMPHAPQCLKQFSRCRSSFSAD